MEAQGLQGPVARGGRRGSCEDVSADPPGLSLRPARPARGARPACWGFPWILLAFVLGDGVGVHQQGVRGLPMFGLFWSERGEQERARWGMQSSMHRRVMP